jgi:hypothetical protein
MKGEKMKKPCKKTDCRYCSPSGFCSKTPEATCPDYEDRYLSGELAKEEIEQA